MDRRTFMKGAAAAAAVPAVPVGLNVASAGPAAAAEPPPLDWRTPLEEIRRRVGAVRAGRALTPRSWPNGGRVAVAFTFDVDNETLSFDEPVPSPLSQGEYGATTGLPRILRLLQRRQVPGSFYIPVASAFLDPEMVPAIMRDRRHEIGIHGWVHENALELPDAATEQRLLAQSIEYFTEVTGTRPVGHRAPSWSFSLDTLRLVQEAGFLYDSSLMAMDGPYELLADGEPTGLVEVPVEWILDDFPYFGSRAQGSQPVPEYAFDVYREEFDVAYAERGMFMLTMHPHVGGHRSRVKHLEKLIDYIQSKPRVWFATVEEIAQAAKSTP